MCPARPRSIPAPLRVPAEALIRRFSRSGRNAPFRIRKSRPCRNSPHPERSRPGQTLAVTPPLCRPRRPAPFDGNGRAARTFPQVAGAAAYSVFPEFAPPASRRQDARPPRCAWSPVPAPIPSIHRIASGDNSVPNRGSAFHRRRAAQRWRLSLDQRACSAGNLCLTRAGRNSGGS